MSSKTKFKEEKTDKSIFGLCILFNVDSSASGIDRFLSIEN